MLMTKFELRLPYRVVIYLRMSSDKQNPRSPDQQKDVIEGLIKQMGLPWQIVAVYRDDGISARFTRKRPDYQRMVKDLKSKRIPADLILVDSFERLTRSDDGAGIRRSFQRMGLLVLTADSHFNDPTTTAGRALSAFESIRASEDGRLKAHNVLRGKRDAVRQKQWPGGAAPLGFRLRPVYKTVKGLDEIDHRVPEPDPSTRWIIEEIFRLADELGYGTGRIAKALNNDPRIPDDLKPFHPATIGETLDNEMHIGEYIWGKNCTGIVDEVRVIQPLPKDEWLHILEFCEPIIERTRWDRVQALRQARRDKRPKRDDSQQQVVGLTAPGLALKYPLTGLVYCAHCQRRMIAQSSSPYETVSGEERRYVNYGCSGIAGGLCHNRQRVPEVWLRQIVVGLMRSRLHLDDCNPEHPAMVEFIEIVRRELESHDALQPDPSLALLAEQRELEERCRGWVQSLGNPSLSPIVRLSIEAEFERATARIRQIDADRASRQAGRQQRQQVLDPDEISQSLQQLATMLNGSNASAINLMLSHHIDSISCDDAGHVTVRTCKLGALAGNLDLFISDFEHPPASSEASPARFRANPRRRARLDIQGAIEDDEMAAEANEFAVDTDRFAGLGPEWFTEDHFDVPVTLSWAESNALAVAEFRLSSHASMDVTAKHFGKTVPTIRAALKYAKEKYGIDAFGKAISRLNLPNWSRSNAQAVVEFMKQPGVTMKTAVRHFERTEPTIRKALEFAKTAAAQADAPKPDDGEVDNRADAA